MKKILSILASFLFCSAVVANTGFAINIDAGVGTFGQIIKETATKEAEIGFYNVDDNTGANGSLFAIGGGVGHLFRQGPVFSVPVGVNFYYLDHNDLGLKQYVYGVYTGINMRIMERFKLSFRWHPISLSTDTEINNLNTRFTLILGYFLN